MGEAVGLFKNNTFISVGTTVVSYFQELYYTVHEFVCLLVNPTIHVQIQIIPIAVPFVLKQCFVSVYSHTEYIKQLVTLSLRRVWWRT